MDLLIRFTDQSNSFTYGVEYGRILEKIERGDVEVSNNKFPVRVENKDVLISTCNAYGFNPIFNNCEAEGWVYFKAIKQSLN